MTDKDKQKVVYDKRIFTFIDIIGFEELVNNSKDDPTKILEVYDSLKAARKMIQVPVGQSLQTVEVDFKEYYTHFFSDTVIMSCPYKSFGYFNIMIAWVMWFQYRMWADRGFFVRGSIVYNDIYQEGDIVFGPAMIDAYHLEKDKNKAVWPRILVDQSILYKLSTEERDKAFAQILQKDETGLVFLDYLGDLFRTFAYNEYIGKMKELSGPIKLFEDHKARIEKAMINARKLSPEKKEHVLEKYKYLAIYHNSVIDKKCNTIVELANNPTLIRDIVSATTKEALHIHRGLGPAYTSPYTAENPQYADTMSIFGIASDKIQNDKNRKGIRLDNPDEIINIYCDEIPRHLSQLEEALRMSKINQEAFS